MNIYIYIYINFYIYEHVCAEILQVLAWLHHASTSTHSTAVLSQAQGIKVFPRQFQDDQLRVSSHSGTANFRSQQSTFPKVVALLQDHQLIGSWTVEVVVFFLLSSSSSLLLFSSLSYPVLLAFLGDQWPVTSVPDFGPSVCDCTGAKWLSWTNSSYYLFKMHAA